MFFNRYWGCPFDEQPQYFQPQQDMKLIEYSNLLGFVVAYDKDSSQCLYYHAELKPSTDVVKAIKFAFGDVYLIPTNSTEFALKILDMLNVSDNDYTNIVMAIKEVSGNEI